MDDYLHPHLRNTFKTARQLEENYGMDNLINGAAQIASYQNSLGYIPVPPYVNEITKQMKNLTPVLQAAGIMSNSNTFEIDRSQRAFLALDRTLSKISNAEISLNNLVDPYLPYLNQYKEITAYFAAYPQFKKPFEEILKELETNTLQKNILHLQDVLEFEEALEENLIVEDIADLELKEKISNKIKFFLLKAWLHTKDQQYISNILFILKCASMNYIGNEILEIIDLPADIEALFDSIITFYEKKRKSASENKENK